MLSLINDESFYSLLSSWRWKDYVTSMYIVYARSDFDQNKKFNFVFVLVVNMKNVLLNFASSFTVKLSWIWVIWNIDWNTNKFYSIFQCSTLDGTFKKWQKGKRSCAMSSLSVMSFEIVPNMRNTTNIPNSQKANINVSEYRCLWLYLISKKRWK